jgi:predicted transglutaminase-like cysteine proteinase
MHWTGRTYKTALVAVSLAMTCSLPYVTRADIDYPCDLKMATEGANFNVPAAAPLKFLAFSRELNLEAEWVSADSSAIAPNAFISLPRDPNGPGLRMSISLPKAVSDLVWKSANLQPVSTSAGFKSRPTIHLPDVLEPNVDRLNFETPILAPMAFMRFCIRYPQDCKVQRMSFRPAPVTLTKARKAELAKVNRDVNRTIKPQANLNGVMAEEWLVAPLDGDCNDYAVTKRHELLARGWPSRSLLLAEAVVASGEHHLVLVVRTREDDLVLDSLSSIVRPIAQIHYRWVRGQQPGNPKLWSAINVTRTARLAMNTR